MKHKLASLLALRKHLREKLTKLAAQAEGLAYSAENGPDKIRKTMTGLADAIAAASAAIAHANATVTITRPTGEVMTLSVLKAMRDEYVKSAAALRTIAELPRTKVVTGGMKYDEEGNRVRVPDEKLTCLMDTEAAAHTANDLAKLAREYDEILQSTNWSTDVEANVAIE